jgi:hypothetical protein
MGSRKYRTRSTPYPRSVPTSQKLERATGKQNHRVSKSEPTASDLRRSACLQDIVKGIKAKEHHRQPPSSPSTASHKRPQSQQRKQLHLHDTYLDERSPSDRSRVNLKSYVKVPEPPHNPVDERSPSDRSRVSLKSYEKVPEPPYNPVGKRSPSDRSRVSLKSYEKVPEPPYNPVNKRSPSGRSRVSLKSYKKVLDPPYNPVAYWAKTTFWPKEFGEKGFPRNYDNILFNINFENITKPGSSEMAQYLDCTKEMASHGIHMEGRDLIHVESMNLFQNLLTTGSHRIPDKGLCYPVERISEMLQLHITSGSSEARVQKDITPWVVPSIQDLLFRRETGLNYIGEAIREEWLKCDKMGNSRPEPDYVVGLLPNKAFTSDEFQRLEKSPSAATGFFFTRLLCFPFLICEVESGEYGLEGADQQNIHSASIAVRAIIELYQNAFGAQSDRVKKLYGQVLVFTVSHNDRQAKLYGHYVVDGGRSDGMLEFRRHLIKTCSFIDDGGAARFTAYGFVRNVYEKFAPDHLKRITEAAAALPASHYGAAMSFQGVTAKVNDQNKVLEQENKQLHEQNKKRDEENKLLLEQLHEQNKKRDEENKLLLEQFHEQNKKRDEENKLVLEQKTEEIEQLNRELQRQNEEMEHLKNQLIELFNRNAWAQR